MNMTMSKLFYELNVLTVNFKQMSEEVKTLAETMNPVIITNYLNAYGDRNDKLVNRLERHVQIFKTNPWAANYFIWKCEAEKEEFLENVDLLHYAIAYYRRTEKQLRETMVKYSMSMYV